MDQGMYDKLVLVSKTHKNVCINVNDFLDILKESAIDKTIDVGDEFKPITDVEVLRTGLYATVGGANCYVSPIVGPGNIRTSDLSIPATRMCEFRKNGDDKVQETISANWSEEMSICEYKWDENQ